MSEAFALRVVRRFARAVPGNSDRLVVGQLYVNDQLIGNAYENDSLKILQGSYPGLLRYWSSHNFVQGPFGTLGHVGDFLIQLDDVVNEEGDVRTGILFHGGNQPKHSKGCILLGPVRKDPSGGPVLDNTDPLRRLRMLFYGTDVPNSTPNKAISVAVASQPVDLTGTWRGTFSLTQGGTTLPLPAILTVAANGSATIQVTVTAGPVTIPVQNLMIGADGSIQFVFGVQTFSGQVGSDLATLRGNVLSPQGPEGPMTLTLD